MGTLLACPFCRELYGRGEADRCPTCDIPLVDLEKLPLSHEAALEELANLDAPFDRTLPLLYAGRGRGVLFGLALLGLGAFFAPWVTLERPEPIALSAFELARGNARWLWGGAVGWFLLVAIVASRRTVNELRGARVVAVAFPLMTAIEIGWMLARPPTESRFFSSGLAYGPGLFASLALALAAAFVGARLGGPSDEHHDLLTPLEDAPREPGEPLH